MNYTPEQIAEIFLKLLKEVNGPDVSQLSIDAKKELARNLNTPEEVLIILAKDENEDVRNAVENNPNYKPSKEITLTYEQREALKSLLASSQDENLKSIQF